MESESYQKPVLEVINFSVRDVITTSGEIGGGATTDPWEPGTGGGTII